MKAYLHNYRQSPRKVRAVAGLIRGKKVDNALVELDFLAKRASTPLKKLLLSAISNAKNMGIDKGNLIVKEMRVDKGVTMKRMMPAAMGTGHRINKRTSNVSIVLGDLPAGKAGKVVAIKETKKVKAPVTVVNKIISTKKVVKKTAKAKKVEVAN